MNAVICGQPVLEQAIMFSGMKEHNSRTYSNLSGTTVNRLYHCPAPEHLYSLPCRERKNIPPAHPTIQSCCHLEKLHVKQEEPGALQHSMAWREAFHSFFNSSAILPRFFSVAFLSFSCCFQYHAVLSDTPA